MKNGHQLLYCGRAQANTKNIIPMDPENAKPIRALMPAIFKYYDVN